MSVEVYERDGQEKKDKKNGQNMLDMAARVEQHYTSPSPQASIRAPAFFPALLNWGIVLGLLLGGALGAVFARLLRQGTIAPEGWEGLFSLVPFSFYSFWAFVGAALGLAVVGGITILLAPQPIWQEMTEAEKQVLVEEGQHVVLVEVEE